MKGLKMMHSNDFENMFSPIKINELEIKNRIVMAPMGGAAYAAPDGSPTDYYINYLEARAKGGVGMIVTGNTAINNEQRMATLGFYSPKMISAFARLVEAVKVHKTRIFLQIAHLGGRSLKSVTGKQPVAPSSIKSKLYIDQPRELSKEEIQVLIQEYVQTATWAQEAGFDGVEMHGAHGHDLISQFISPSTNKREDKYGGNFEGRIRFTEKILKGIKDACGTDFPVGLKYNGYEALEGGIDLPLAKKIGQYMENIGGDYLHIASMTYGIDGYKYPSVSPLYTKSGALIELASEVKETLKSIPVIGTGGINKPELAEDILKNRQVDMLALGRALIADPNWVKKARKRRVDKIRPCIRCNVCHKRANLGKLTKCTVNPFLNWQGSQDSIKRARRPKKIVIVGAGPAGIQAALIASKRGHEVTLFEKRDELGGNLIPGTVPKFKADLKMLLQYYRREISNSNVRVNSGVEATSDIILGDTPDIVILAVGAKHIIPDVPGIDRENVLTAIEVLDPQYKKEVGKNAVVLGAGLVGCETAWYLSQQGKSVCVVDVLRVEDILEDEHHTSRATLLKSLDKQNVQILGERTLKKVKQHEVLFKRENGGEESLQADNLVIAVGFTPRREIQKSLSNQIPCYNIYELGDCVTPARLYDAIHGARYTAERV